MREELHRIIEAKEKLMTTNCTDCKTDKNVNPYYLSRGANSDNEIHLCDDCIAKWLKDAKQSVKGKGIQDFIDDIKKGQKAYEIMAKYLAFENYSEEFLETAEHISQDAKMIQDYLESE
jgi:hypothetical protein